jgi:putative hydrolase of the HAD superfamily
MNNIKHFSFDLWLTLIKSNPNFKKERCKFFHKNFNTLNKPLEEVENVFRVIDIKCNRINEITGKNIDSEELYLMVIHDLNNNLNTFPSINLEEINLEMENLVSSYPPIIFCDSTFEVLKSIKQNKDVTLSILSNTGFIKGKTIKKYLDYLDLSQFFSFQIYSDEVGFSKPSIEIFNELLLNIYNFRSEILDKKEIMHVGDNYVADICGASSIGINSFQINSNNNSIKNILDAL